MSNDQTQPMRPQAYDPADDVDGEADTVFSLDTVAERLSAEGIAATIEQTGGGTATLYVGERWIDDDDNDRADVIVGPGWFQEGGFGGGAGAAFVREGEPMPKPMPFSGAMANVDECVVCGDGDEFGEPIQYLNADPVYDCVTLILSTLEEVQMSRCVRSIDHGLQTAEGTAVEMLAEAAHLIMRPVLIAAGCDVNRVDVVATIYREFRLADDPTSGLTHVIDVDDSEALSEAVDYEIEPMLADCGYVVETSADCGMTWIYRHAG